jgi:RNA polymerase sigma-70 factor (ECF subfamily)
VDTKEHNELLVQRIASAQSSLYSFIRSILPDPNAALDVLQETNLILWQKSSEFRPELNFLTWACRIARFQVLAYRRDCGRDYQLFNQPLFDEIADEATEHVVYKGNRQLEALEQCLRKLVPRERELIEERYAEGCSVKSLADRNRTTANSISRRLYRLRGVLLRCIERSLVAGGDI